MKYEIVDFENWVRKDIFNYTLNVHPSKISMTKEIDITNLYNHVRKLNLKFTPTIYYCLGVVVNQLENFRYYMLNDQIVKFDKLNALYTVFHEETKTFSNIWTEFNNDLDTFIANYKDDMDKYRHNLAFQPKPLTSANVYFISNLPWTTYTSIYVEVAEKKPILAPVFFLSRKFERDGKVILPITLNVNHAVCDGYHVEEFFNTFQYFVNMYNPANKESTELVENLCVPLISL